MRNRLRNHDENVANSSVGIFGANLLAVGNNYRIHHWVDGVHLTPVQQ